MPNSVVGEKDDHDHGIMPISVKAPIEGLRAEAISSTISKKR